MNTFFMQCIFQGQIKPLISGMKRMGTYLKKSGCSVRGHITRGRNVRGHIVLLPMLLMSHT
jgi:hypothetical protein